MKQNENNVKCRIAFPQSNHGIKTYIQYMVVLLIVVVLKVVVVVVLIVVVVVSSSGGGSGGSSSSSSSRGFCCCSVTLNHDITPVFNITVQMVKRTVSASTEPLLI